MTQKKSPLPPQIMGILNITPDSFSDGGKYYDSEKAIQHAIIMVEQGAAIIDIGGESTRPGAERVSITDQLKRVIPVIEGIRKSSIKEVIISVDTTRYEVAKTALEAGASWLNDISAGDDSKVKESDKEPMLTLAAKHQCPIVLMHRQGNSATMQNKPLYDDVCAEVNAYLANRAKVALDVGVLKENIIVDPGIGFGKLMSHNLQLLAGLDSLVSLDYKVLLGTSRKRFLGDITGVENPQERLVATCATTALGVNAGVNLFRVHDVLENKQAMDVAWRIKQFSD